MVLHLRTLKKEEKDKIIRISSSTSEELRRVVRAKLLLMASEGKKSPEIAGLLGYILRQFGIGSNDSMKRVWKLLTIDGDQDVPEHTQRRLVERF